MAGELPSLETTRAAVWLHDWHSYEDYKTVQDRYMTQLMNEGLVEENGLVFDEVRDGRALLAVNIAGRLGCAAGVTAEVDKWLDAQPGPRGYLVKGSSYSYQAWLSDTGQEIVRYDSAHGLDDLHCHVFNLKTGEEERISCPLERLPSLDAFVRIAVKMAQDFQNVDSHAGS